MEFLLLRTSNMSKQNQYYCPVSLKFWFLYKRGQFRKYQICKRVGQSRRFHAFIHFYSELYAMRKVGKKGLTYLINLQLKAAYKNII